MRLNIALVIAAWGVLPAWLVAQPVANVLLNGAFAEKGRGGNPTAWDLGKDAQPWRLEPPGEATANKPVLTFTVERAQKNQGAVEQTIRNLPSQTRCVAEARVRATGKELALLQIKLLDAAGKEFKRISSSSNAGTAWETLRVVFNSEAAAGVSVLCRYLQTEAQIGARVSFADVKLYEKKPAVPRREDVYVSPSGKSGASGANNNPLRYIQEALDRAAPGTTVHLAPGVYRERVRFSEGGVAHFPVTLEGAPGAVIDASDPLALAWQPASDIGPGVYKAPLASPVITVTVEDKIVTILDERRVDPENVKKVLARGKNPKALGVVPENIYTPDWAWPIIFQKGIGPSGWEGVKALVMYAHKRKELILRLRDKRDPRTLKLTVAPRLPAVTIKDVDRCVVRGVTIRYGWQGVLVEHSVGSTVEDCRIEITDHGVLLGEGADRCTVRFNEISQDPYAGASPSQAGAGTTGWRSRRVVSTTGSASKSRPRPAGMSSTTTTSMTLGTALRTPVRRGRTRISTCITTGSFAWPMTVSSPMAPARTAAGMTTGSKRPSAASASRPSRPARSTLIAISTSATTKITVVSCPNIRPQSTCTTTPRRALLRSLTTKCRASARRTTGS